ncbi:glycoside hydrolase family 15 protein [Fulvivirga sediminis]|uniref:Glycoside hydrolase family 15 protein n=1 Tax=Fulvivirga sediminis TaxID=2803949 RepID=A0A937F577_9BACT|nr:glycoside hydrolase family 15 protein [Fulvivirga sediminis]MBL3655985.1 glycoside hydrolase family 15 protein [Fulvivirga sediminis]
MTKHTYDYGLIGNCSFQAHVHKNTNIEWMCWPRFDSSFIFGGMLDDENGGEFSIKPEGEIKETHQYYLENTNILVTEITCDQGRYRVTDFAPRFQQFDRYYKPIMLLRKVEPLENSPRVRVKCMPTGDYGRLKPSQYEASNHIEYLGLEKEVRLTTDFPLSYIVEERPIVLNEVKYMALTWGAPLEAPLASTCESFLDKTKRYWRGWVKNMSVSNFHQKEINRSALALKIHQYEDTGAIIAAGTTSLPEAPGSGRNWDYRYCWMRDAYYTLTAFNNIGHFEELERYFNYIVNISVKSRNRFQPLYSVTGEGELTENILDLKGYKGNTPVRVGNQAYTHIQNDVYGQILASLMPLYVDQRFINLERSDSLNLVYDILQKIEDLMEEPDAGLWEFRTLSQYHCYTYLFHWAGAKAAKKIADKFDNEKIKTLADKVIKLSSEKIDACFDEMRGVYTQAIGSKNLDASNLQMIMMGYLQDNPEACKKHLEELEKDLKSQEGLFYRYKHADDFGEPETTFLICAFWYVEALTCVGRIDEAIETFENLLKYSNHLGLLSEDVDAKTGSQWGNFPQAYSHVGLVNAAYRISRKLDMPNFL